MKMIFRLLKFLGSALSIVVIVTIALSVAVWFLAPLVSGAFAGVLARVVAIGVIVLLALATALFIIIRR
ncbi:MAG: hypothetical protein AAF576_11220, partial [Pseudomonadota bacterium]